MSYTITATTPMIDQYARNQMSLMAWVMTFLCGWVMFLSAHVLGAEHVRHASDKTTAATAVTARQ